MDRKKIKKLIYPILIFIFSTCADSYAQENGAATNAIISAFEKFPIVAIGDEHGLAQEADFYSALVRAPHFPEAVGNIVVEFGSAADQPIMDRYTNGDSVPYVELRKVWTDTIGWFPPPLAIGYLNLFAQVRITNATLPEGKKIHVWLGDPPVDWTKLKSREDFKPIPGLRDVFPAEILQNKILDNHKKALVLYGTAHILNKDGLRSIIEAEHPGAILSIFPYTGFKNPQCEKIFEKKMQNANGPAVLTYDATNYFGNEWSSNNCAQELPSISGSATQLLYLGPKMSLVRSPIDPNIYLDMDYRSEVSRHLEIIGPPNADMSLPTLTPEKNTAEEHAYFENVKK